MKQVAVIVFSLASSALFLFSFRVNTSAEYPQRYDTAIKTFSEQQALLLQSIQTGELNAAGRQRLKEEIAQTRLQLKAVDFWLRYLEPIGYRQINGPLPVEWETEAFEKWEPPYKRKGAGLTLAALYLEEETITRDTLLHLIQQSVDATKIFTADSITRHLATFDHFYFCNRLFLLNLAAIYTTGFECPDTENVIPELRHMLAAVKQIYSSFNNSFPATPLSAAYLALYDSALSFVNEQPSDFSTFDHFTFIKEYVNPLFALNQQFIQRYKAVSRSFNDYSINKQALSIFDKSFYNMQHPKGIFSLVDDIVVLNEIDRIGKLLFYDPILSGNNMRSCASCHVPKQYFTDTTAQTALQFDRIQRLPRNTPSLINVIYNHLLMLDGKHISLLAQAKDVTSNPVEMEGSEREMVEKVMSCKEYKTAFKKLLKHTPGETEVTARHILSAITFYMSKFSAYSAPFDDAMHNKATLDARQIKGFNLFMSKAECGTCHFVPFFNGVKPPYTGSEFEVLGTPADTGFSALSPDKGRYEINPAPETLHAFRTGTLRNIAHTKPYMHNGVFNTLDEVLDFYNNGGGQGHGLDVPNQTLSGDSLHLTPDEKDALVAFMRALDENIVFENPPPRLPESSDATLNTRRVSGEY